MKIIKVSLTDAQYEYLASTFDGKKGSKKEVEGLAAHCIRQWIEMNQDAERDMKIAAIERGEA